MDESHEGQLEAAAALADPLRRALYLYVCAADGEVGRDQAAHAVGAGRDRVASQLDKLAEAGLLEVSFRRLSGRSGPGAGRPAKVYRPSPLQIDISVPPRRYDLAADVFAGALEAAGIPQAAVDGSAWEFGHTVGQEARSAAEGRRTRRAVSTLQAMAEDYGFQPVVAAGGMALTNCPFRSLVESRGQLICRMCLSLFNGMLAGLGAEGMQATTVPAPRGQGCCVRVELRRRPALPSQL